jgi:Icc-related predicted phosphoesterase
MRLVLLSDTHGLHDALPSLPDGDVLVHAGDVTRRGSLAEVRSFFDWFAGLSHRHKVVVAGNHDFAFQDRSAEAEALVPAGVTYLKDSGTIIEGVRFWGSPWQPWFHDWAFNLPRGEALARVWAGVPDDVHVLVTHGPPHGILDRVVVPPGQHVGCEMLRERLAALPALRLHVFGHIHEDYGIVEDGEANGRRTFVNACICDVRYRPVNRPLAMDLE